ncbi:2315_t:CDS:2 [Rhizophagus irregularis]|nr:2315_t:CDS:2 [Rhizophagus irregularis]
MELWLVEGEAKLVNPSNVVQHIVVWLCDMPEPDEYDFYIKEINARFQQQTNERIAEIESQHLRMDQDRLATKYGLIKPESCHIKTDALNNWHKNSGIRRNLVASKLCACWAIEAKALKLAFSTTMTENTYQELQETLKKEREILIQVNPNIYTILTAWYATENFNTINSQEFEDKQDDDNITICCHNSNFIDISLNSRWSAKKVNDRGLSKKLDYKHPFFQDISVSYREHFNSKEAILNRKLEFYNSISYTILKDGQDPIRLKIHIGDIVELPEESEGIAYAKATNIMDSVLECPFYNIQKPEESRWFQNFPITFIDRNPCVFFIHNCGNTCNTEHDEENRSYILNRYYYNAV